MSTPEKPTVRVSIKDAEQTVSCLAGPDTMLRLIAGCSASPSTLGELLVAADVYERGIAARVMADLMDFDKALQQEGSIFIHDAIRLAREQGRPLAATFQVIDSLTESEALEQPRCQLVVIDLVERVIRASGGLNLPASGEVRIHDGRVLTDRTVTYLLPQDWQIQTV